MEINKEFLLSQTALKDLEKEETCPDRWRAQWIDKEISFPSNEDMDKGKYFEYLAIGAGAVSGEDVTDLPRLQNGRKSIDQVRIEEQAARFKRFIDKQDPEFQGFELGETQIELKIGNRKGTIDFETIEVADGSRWINDLKLTKDLTSTRSQYGWGHPWKDLDLVQMVHYSDLYEEKTGIKPRIGLWVFDYSPELRIKFGEIKVSQKARNAKELRFSAAEEVIELYKINGWIKQPSEYECRRCTLNCSVRFKPGPIEKLIINI